MEGGGLDVGLLHGEAEVSAVVHNQGGLGGQIVEQAAGLGVEIGQIPFDASEALAGAQGFQLVADLLFDAQNQVGGGQKLDQLVVLAPQCPQTVLGQGLAARPDLQALHPVDRALGGRVEDAQAVHLVAEEIDAHRLGQVGGPDVDDAAPAGEGARLFDDFDRVVAALHPADGEALQTHNIPHGDGAQGHAQLFGGQGLVHEGAGRGHDQGGRAVGRALQGGQGGQAALHGHIRPVDALVGQGFGFGEDVDQGRFAQFRVTGGRNWAICSANWKARSGWSVMRRVGPGRWAANPAATRGRAEPRTAWGGRSVFSSRARRRSA